MKKWIAFMLILATCASFAACGETPVATTTAPVTPTTTANENLDNFGSDSTTAAQPAETTAPTPAQTTVPVQTTAAPIPTTPAVPDMSGYTLELGTQMPDFTIYDVNGNCYTLYGLLEEKKAVMLNFWYADCPYCLLEFPDIQDAYERYSDQVEILAINPIDSVSKIIQFQEKRGLTFPLCKDGPKLNKPFVKVGYPTTVIIDRYGTVCLIQIGAQGGNDVFGNAFAYFCSDDYEPGKLSDDILDFQP